MQQVKIGKMKKREFFRSRLMRWSSRFIREVELDSCLAASQTEEASDACFRLNEASDNA